MGLNRCDISNDLMLSRKSKTKDDSHIYNGWNECKQQLKEILDMDEEYKCLMLIALSDAEKSESRKRKRERHNDVGEENESDSVDDPQYELFLSRLKLYEKSYIFEGEKNGVPMVIKYEELGSSKDGCAAKPWKKTKNHTGQKNVFSNEKPSLGDNWATENQVEHEVKARPGKKAKVQKQHNLLPRLNKSGNMKRQHDMQTRCDKKRNVPTRRNVRSTVKIDRDNWGEDVQDAKLSTANEKDSGKTNQKKKDDESASDLEVLETAEFGKEGNCGSVLPSKKFDKCMNEDDFQHPCGYSEFRKQVINILRKPYNREEYDELRQAVKARTTEDSDGDLCTRSKKSYGKSYLNYYPDLQRKLKKFEKDRQKNLNTLRGFFFWLEHITMEGAFKPWKDPECCAVEQENCPPPPPPPPAPHRLGIPSEPGNHPESIAQQENCQPPPPTPPCRRGRKRRTNPSKPGNDHASVAVEQENCSPRRGGARRFSLGGQKLSSQKNLK
ncbi:Uncharacterized protein Fot_20777 [Forsythia ovata]|uniref:Uncharacterized protein n=1 Tax=Forsythia ovata TaxID=205694 RepID=A0ABD1USY4_9LAMI